jgi:lambda family phage minor tail protein L
MSNGVEIDQRILLGESARSLVGKSLIENEPTAVIELYELYFDVDEEPFRFHSGTNNLTKDIIWNKNSYYATAIQVEGFEANIMGRLPRPKVTVANIDYIISNILRDYSDFRNGKFVRIKLFLKHLDAVNFDGGENPFGSPNELAYISKERYLISQKIIENKQIIQFELITPFDLESLETASRGIYGRYCYWQYRGLGCNYQGDLICKEDDTDFTTPPSSTMHIKNAAGNYIDGTFEETIKKFVWTIGKSYIAGDIVYVENLDINGLKDPARTWFVCIKNNSANKYNSPNKDLLSWEKDGCSKSVSACQKRFLKNSFINSKGYIAYNDTLEVNSVLPFGGFPGTDKFKYE